MTEIASENALVESAARWLVYYAGRPPRPLAFCPCFYFTVDQKGMPNSDSIRFVPVTDALSCVPEAILRRAKLLPRYPTTHAIVLAYALDSAGELLTDALVAPARYVFYVHIPSQWGVTMFERRMASAIGDAVIVSPDEALPFDLRGRLQLGQVASHRSDASATCVDRLH